MGCEGVGEGLWAWWWWCGGGAGCRWGGAAVLMTELVDGEEEGKR